VVLVARREAEQAEVAAVIAAVIERRAPDVYTRPGARERVARYYETVGTDP
jgi:hypothetical protein